MKPQATNEEFESDQDYWESIAEPDPGADEELDLDPFEDETEPEDLL